MQLSEREEGGVLVVAVTGRVDSNTAPEFEERLLGAISQGRRNIILNFSAMDYISSAGLRVLLKAARELKTQSGSLAVCCMRDYIREVFDLSGFTAILTVETDEAGALERAAVN